MFSPETYTRRRNQLASRMTSGMLLFPGNGESPMNYAANPYPFRQDSTFLYYFGLSQPGLAAVMDVDHNQVTIFGEDPTIDEIVWMGDMPSVAQRAESTGVHDTRPLADMTEVVAAARDAGRRVHFLPPYRADTTNLLSGLLDIHISEVKLHASTEFIEAVVAQRSCKDVDEIAELERAVATSVRMHETAIRMARPGMKESDIAAEVERIAVAAGGRVAYPVIATVNGQILHNYHHGNTLSEGDVFLMDAGAETSMGYAGDLTSTFPVSRRFHTRQRTIYEIVQEAYAEACSMLRPGVHNRQVHLAASRTIFEGMKGLGIMRGDTEEAVAAGAHALVFPHGIGHMIGLDVHDMENLGEELVGYAGEPRSTQFGLKSLRLARKLEAGFTITVEPGIYFIPQLMDRWRAGSHLAQFINYDELDLWRDFGGVRLEEDFLITADGARRLGPLKPNSLEEIEALRSATVP